jgi:hypothetical protein
MAQHPSVITLVILGDVPRLGKRKLRRRAGLPAAISADEWRQAQGAERAAAKRKG